MQPSALYRVAAALFLSAALCALAVACGACGCAQHAGAAEATAGPPLPRPTSVLLVEVCANAQFYGTGVVVNDRQVLTARHMTECDVNGDGVVDSSALVVEAYVRGAAPVMLVPDVAPPDADVARLVGYPGSFHGFAAPELGPRPEVGAVVCWDHMFPSIGERCARVVDGASGPLAIRVDEPVEKGNSGSPLYDAGGRLVGIVKSYYSVARIGVEDIPGGGEAVDVTGALSWIVPPLLPPGQLADGAGGSVL